MTVERIKPTDTRIDAWKVEVRLSGIPRIEQHKIARATATRVYFSGLRWENKRSGFLYSNTVWFLDYSEAVSFISSLLIKREVALTKEVEEIKQALKSYSAELFKLRK